MKKVMCYLKERFDIIVYFILSIVLLLMMRKLLNINVYGFRAILSNMFFIFVISSPMWLLRKRLRYIYGILTLIVMTILVVSQVIHFTYFNDVYSFSKMILISELLSVKSEITSKIDFSLLIFSVPIVIYVLYITIVKIKETNNKKLSIVFFVLILIASCLGTIFLDNTIKNDDDWTVSDVYLYNTLYSKTKMINRFGFFKYMFRDIELLVEKSNSISDPDVINEIDEYIIEQSQLQKNDMTGIFKDKNLILILAESLSYGAIDSEINPNLYKLASEGFYFTNNYAPKFLAATGDSEFISLTSMLPSVSTVTAYKYHRNKYPYALPQLFQNLNYSVNSFHNYISNFYNREIFHDSLGFDTFYDMEKLQIKRFDGYVEGVNWPSDVELVEKMTTILENDTSSKFFSYLITVSGHMPYIQSRIELKEAYEFVDIRSDYSEEVTAYLASQNILDQAIELLLNRLEELDLLNDTVIIIYGDHYPYGLSEEGLLELNNYSEFDEIEKHKTPLIIWSNDIENIEITKVSSTFDIYPTICNLFALETKDQFIVGNDVFSENEGIVYFPDMSWITDYSYFDIKSNTYTMFMNNEQSDYRNQTSNIVSKLFKLSENILLTDYYRR